MRGGNKYGKKNFMGAFAVPHAVVNDFNFLHTQPQEVCRDGLVEAVKVALVKDGAFFRWIEKNRTALATLDESTLEEAVERSAILHARHIAEGGDPFESGSSRPLDFGHWSAHKLEQLSQFRLSHARAVSIGLAVDCLYSVRKGLLTESECERVFRVLEALELPLWDELLLAQNSEGHLEVLNGLQEFREHLGGELTILLLAEPGRGVEVHEMNEEILGQVFEELKERALSAVS
jgi:3-dehydroquinate synthase